MKIPRMPLREKTEDAIEENTEGAIEEKTEDAVEENTEGAIEEKPEDAIEKKPEDAIEEKPEDAIEEKPEDAIEVLTDNVNEDGWRYNEVDVDTIMTDKDMDEMTDKMNELFKTMKIFTDNYKTTIRQKMMEKKYKAGKNN